MPGMVFGNGKLLGYGVKLLQLIRMWSGPKEGTGKGLDAVKMIRILHIKIQWSATALAQFAGEVKANYLQTVLKQGSRSMAAT